MRSPRACRAQAAQLNESAQPGNVHPVRVVAGGHDVHTQLQSGLHPPGGAEAPVEGAAVDFHAFVAALGDQVVEHHIQRYAVPGVDTNDVVEVGGSLAHGADGALRSASPFEGLEQGSDAGLTRKMGQGGESVAFLYYLGYFPGQVLVEAKLASDGLRIRYILIHRSHKSENRRAEAVGHRLQVGFEVGSRFLFANCAAFGH